MVNQFLRLLSKSLENAAFAHVPIAESYVGKVVSTSEWVLTCLAFVWLEPVHSIASLLRFCYKIVIVIVALIVKSFM